ncbi:MAG: 26S proteasome non-ATPase regulatory subunit [archaeon]|nr:26S proteasome non-ATPase regulatory subunit [archaeon]
MLVRASSGTDPRLLARVVRSITLLRRSGGLTPSALLALIRAHFSVSGAELALLSSAVELLPPEDQSSAAAEGTVVSDDPPNAASEPSSSTAEAPSPRSEEEAAAAPLIQLYLLLLVLISLIDAKQVPAALPVANALLELLGSTGNRRISSLASKAYYFYGRVYELAGRSAETREPLLKAYRTAVLRHDDETEATIINLLLRHYLQSKQYEQADYLLSSTKFEEALVSPNQCARYLYYKARVLSIQLAYKEAEQLLSAALSKAPHVGAMGFRITVQKWLCLVQLLLGRIPEKRIFRNPAFSRALTPYRKLTQAVNVGELASFQQVVADDHPTFHQDDTLVLISRLRASVIKAGLRKIGLAYTRISLADIQSKLRLDSLESVEFVVAKAIRDGVIDGRINAVAGFLETNAHSDVYSTHEPMEVFHTKIQSCLELHNSAVKGMRFPPEILKTTHRTRYGSDEEDIDPEALLEDELEDDL